MNKIGLLESIAISVVSGIGGAAALWRFATDAWLEKRKAEWNQKLEAFKDSLSAEQKRLQAQLDGALFVSRSHFEVELNAMREVHQALAKVKLTFRALNPISASDEAQDQERTGLVQQFRTAIDQYFAKLEEWAAFIEPQLYDYFERAFYGADAEWKRLFNHQSGNTSLIHQQFLSNYQNACQETRNRLKKLEILHSAVR
jgi:hypothetical protein